MNITRSHSRGRHTDADKKRYEDEPKTRESSPGDCGLVCPQHPRLRPWDQAPQVEKDSGTDPLPNWEPIVVEICEKPGLKIRVRRQDVAWGIQSKGYIVFTPRALDPMEEEEIRKASRYRRILEENRVVRRFGKESSSPGQSSPKPSTEDPDIPDTNRIPLFDSLTQMVPLLEPKSDTTLGQHLVVVGNETDGCAVKRLHESTSAEQFWAEYLSLKRLKSLNHPHLIETLSVLREEIDTKQRFSFVFPLALSNLKRLFRDSVVPVPLRNRNLDSLWEQFSGLSSAVAYLHDSAHMAHRDIKPSNILIYEDPSGAGISLKLTDFGLSVDLSRARTWEQGSRARQSAWLYDSPEVRKVSPMAGLTEPSARISIPSSSDLMANDIWKLGCVFTEMLAYLVGGGSSGVEAFRNHITTTEDKISSDVINDTRFDDGEKVKSQVLEFIDRMAHKDYRAEMLQSVISVMLAKSALRPTIADVCENLAENNFPNISYNDGVRMVRLKIEELTRRPIDWAPLQQPLPKVGAGDYIATWKANLGQPSQSSLGTNVLTANFPPAVQTSVDTKDIYWCIERNFTEPTEIYLSPIQNAEKLDDEQLFRQVNKAIGSTEGWIRRLFSWKRCTAIDFVQFLVIWENKDQVNPIQKELPPPATPFYNHSVPLPHDFHMRAAGLQMVFGLRDPKKGRGETTIIDMLPKKRNPPPFSKRISEPGWGLHAKMGFSQRRFLAWLCFCIILGGIFVVFWLVFINKTDLQNAYIPTFLFAALLTVAMGLLQVA
ncbi:serine threonine kinase [Fusarium phyllophilum]|uniref:Serine threonine kinase n=1 Tax=Fusarium phyllophilum TaxID=47803 RepID=A0A8H5J3T6_9HYPO|nr:serine threonine kinase [Fusarium phyllophilum]